jgi:hypothetical protein
MPYECWRRRKPWRVEKREGLPATPEREKGCPLPAAGKRKRRAARCRQEGERKRRAARCPLPAAGKRKRRAARCPLRATRYRHEKEKVTGL